MLRWRIAVLIGVAIAISYLDRSAFPAAFTAIKADFHFNNTDKAFLDSAFLVAYGLMYLGGGKLLDILGTRRGFTLVIAFWSLACLSHGFAMGFWSLILARLLLGMGEGGGFPAATRAVAEWFPVKERSSAMGIMNGGSSVGSIIASPLILILIIPYFTWFGMSSWRWGFFVTGSLGFLWLGWWLYEYYTPEKHPRLTEAERVVIEEGRARTSVSLPKVPMARLFEHREMWGLMAAKFLTDAGWYFYNFWLPTYLQQARGLNFRETGSINWIPAAASGVGCITAGLLCTLLMRKGFSVSRARKLALAAGVVCMPFVMLVPYVSVPWVIVIFSLAFFGHQSWSTLVMVLPTDLFPRRALGTVAGLVGMSGAFGGIAMGQLAGYLLDHGFSYKPILVVAGLLHVTGFGIILLTIRKLDPLPIDVKAVAAGDVVGAG